MAESNENGVLGEKERVIVLLNETAKAFQLEVASLQQELTRATMQLLQKDALITDLRQHVQDLENVYADQNKGSQGLQSQLDVQMAAVAEIQDQLRNSDAEFEALRATFEAKDTELKGKTIECRNLNVQLVGLENEVDRLNVVVRRQDKQLLEKAESVPKMADACLSARDYSENQLISLRDDAIQAKAKELSLVTAANDALRAQLDAVETELEHLQQTLSNKDMDIYRKAKRIDKLERQVEKLEAAVKQSEGRELAMELSTKQNTQLLQCLQSEEIKTEALRQQVDALTKDLEHVQEQSTQIRSEAAVVEIDVQLKTKTLERQSANLNASLDKLQKEREKMRDEMTELRSKARLEAETMQGELVQRRNKQYEITLKLHETESQLHTFRSQNELLDEELQATRARMNELERLYGESKRWKEEMLRSSELLKSEHSQLQRTHANESKLHDVEKTALLNQLKEVERFVKIQAQEAEKKDELKQGFRTEAEKMGREIHDLHDRIHALVAEVNRETRLRVGVEMELKMAQDQLHLLHTNSHDLLAGCHAQHKKLEDDKERVLKQLAQLEYEYKREHHGKTQLLQLYFTVGDRHQGNLVECWLSDSDLPTVVRGIQGLEKPLEALDLRSNRITDNGVKYLLQLLKSRNPKLALNLQENYISPQGVRQLASGLEALGHTIVIHEGRIEAGELVVDTSNNKDAAILVYVPPPVKSKPKKAKDKIPAKPDPLQDIYGVDLVQTLMEKSTPQKKETKNQTNQSPRGPLSPRAASLPKL
ncbi:Aste57867_15222 [Aphanomyces stellatus]|uniref:Aste57867_15222 protein n=1 Tax=Aphanomyces stellatus TaxID=120398 RepID=A0A485L4G5_9STRA|nr:hypothetical protein As57867_015166 [Aphanomyces stellatus]VFT92031.1 Aste57867_15222 [Aphanomyces stellatus]